MLPARGVGLFGWGLPRGEVVRGGVVLREGLHGLKVVEMVREGLVALKDLSYVGRVFPLRWFPTRSVSASQPIECAR